MSGKKFLAMMLASSVAVTVCSSAIAKTLSLDEIEEMPAVYEVKTAQSKVNNDSWQYRSLIDLAKKYGVPVKEELKEDNAPLTRSEAAVILVNLVGQIEKNKVQVAPTDNYLIQAMQQNFSKEITQLAARVSKLESSVASLEGVVSKVDDSKNLKFNYGEGYKVTGGLQMKGAVVTNRGDAQGDSNFSIPLAEFGITGKIHENIDYRVSMFPSRNIGGTKEKDTLLGDAYVGTKIGDHNTVRFGQQRVPIGVEGTTSAYSIDFIDSAQIAKKFSGIRDTGLKVIGKYKYADYYAGVFNGERYATQSDSNTDTDVSGWVTFKPFADNTDLGELKIGTGYTIGKSDYSYDVFGAYLSYKLGKATLKTEYAYADGYNGTNQTKGDGIYVTGLYDFNEKYQLALRADYFDTNTQTDDSYQNEYTIGMNYFLKGRNLMLRTNYVYVQDDGRDSQRFVVQTQCFL